MDIEIRIAQWNELCSHFPGGPAGPPGHDGAPAIQPAPPTPSPLVGSLSFADIATTSPTLLPSAYVRAMLNSAEREYRNLAVQPESGTVAEIAQRLGWVAVLGHSSSASADVSVRASQLLVQLSQGRDYYAHTPNYAPKVSLDDARAYALEQVAAFTTVSALTTSEQLNLTAANTALSSLDRTREQQTQQIATLNQQISAIDGALSTQFTVIQALMNRIHEIEGNEIAQAAAFNDSLVEYVNSESGGGCTLGSIISFVSLVAAVASGVGAVGLAASTAFEGVSSALPQVVDGIKDISDGAQLPDTVKRVAKYVATASSDIESLVEASKKAQMAISALGGSASQQQIAVSMSLEDLEKTLDKYSNVPHASEFKATLEYYKSLVSQRAQAFGVYDAQVQARQNLATQLASLSAARDQTESAIAAAANDVQSLAMATAYYEQLSGTVKALVDRSIYDYQSAVLFRTASNVKDAISKGDFGPIGDSPAALNAKLAIIDAANANFTSSCFNGSTLQNDVVIRLPSRVLRDLRSTETAIFWLDPTLREPDGLAVIAGFSRPMIDSIRLRLHRSVATHQVTTLKAPFDIRLTHLGDSALRLSETDIRQYFHGARAQDWDATNVSTWGGVEGPKMFEDNAGLIPLSPFAHWKIESGNHLGAGKASPSWTAIAYIEVVLSLRTVPIVCA